LQGTPPQLILASTSPRRRELLALLQIPFEVEDPGFQEDPEHLDTWHSPNTPSERALRFADGKAGACAASRRDALILACDTLIELDGKVLGKPTSLGDARSMLRALRGREHRVHSAVALRRERIGLRERALESVRVRMRAASDEGLERYLAGGEWVGKAGAYAIQGEAGALIAAIDGDYTAVVGLPLRLVAKLLGPHIPLAIDVEALYRLPPHASWSRFSAC
jgi:nucleoside triphosphate pyrophosphatase